MKKFIVMAAVAAVFGMSFTACSNNEDEVLASNAKQNIGFIANVEGSAVATRGYATTAANALSTIESFQTWAYDDTTDGLYMGTSATAGREVSNTGTALAPIWAYSPTQFWPANDLNFVAITPSGLSGGITGNSTASASNVVTLTTNVTLPTDVENQKDIMFAEADGIDKDDDTGNVPFTFKHALSQIVFKGKFDGEHAVTKVTIAEISLCNINKTGVLTFNSEGYFFGSTSSTAVTKVPAASLSTPANFTLESGDLEDYIFDEADVIGHDDVEDEDILRGTTPFDLTVSENATKKNAWFMLPQAVTAWDGATVDGNGVPSDGGAYIKLRVKLEKDNVVIKDSQEADALYLPLTIAWDRSKKYIYTIQFNGDNALTPITFSVAAQDWTDADPQPDVIEF